jgi:hypothetical protein
VLPANALNPNNLIYSTLLRFVLARTQNLTAVAIWDFEISRLAIEGTFAKQTCFVGKMAI